MNAPAQPAKNLVSVTVGDKTIEMEDGKPVFRITPDAEAGTIVAEIVTQDGQTSTYTLDSSSAELLWAYVTKGFQDHLKRILVGCRSAVEFDKLRDTLARGPEARRPRSLVHSYTLLEQAIAEATGQAIEVVHAFVEQQSPEAKRALGRDARVAPVFVRLQEEDRQRRAAKALKAGKSVAKDAQKEDLLAGLLSDNAE